MDEEFLETDEIDERVTEARSKVDDVLRKVVYTPGGKGLIAEWVVVVAAVDPQSGISYIQCFTAEGQVRHHTLGLFSAAEEQL